MSPHVKRTPCSALRGLRRQPQGGTLTDQITDAYAISTSRPDVESPDAPEVWEGLPPVGVQTHAEYTLYGHFLFLQDLLPHVEKWRFALDQDSGMRAACLGAFHEKIKARTCDAFYVRINKELNIDMKRKAAKAAQQAIDAKALSAGLSHSDAVKELFKDRLAALVSIGPWKDKWLEHPTANMSEAEKATCWLTDYADYDHDHLARLHAKQSLHGVDSLFNQMRRHASMFERPISTPSAKKTWSGYQPYCPVQVERMLMLLKVCHNYVWKGEDGKTPAMRIGLAKGPIDYEDIIHFIDT